MPGGDEYLLARAQRLFGDSRSGDEVSRQRRVASWGGVSHEDAAGQAQPRIAARDFARRDFDELVGTPVRHHPRHFRAAPRQRFEHASVRARQYCDRARKVGALHGELAARIFRRFDRHLERPADGFEPAQRIEAHRAGDAPVRARAEAKKLVVEIGELRRHPFRGRRRGCGFRQGGTDAFHQAAVAIPRGPALRDAIEQQDRGRRTDPHDVLAHDRVLERLERRERSRAHVPIAVTRRGGVHGTNYPDQQQHAQQNRHHRHAGSDGKAKQRGALLSRFLGACLSHNSAAMAR